MGDKRKKESKVPNLRFPGFYGEWEETRLGEVSELITKGTTPGKFVNQGVKFIKIECFDGDKINEHKCLFIDEQTHNKELKRSILKENDLLFAIAGATVGKVNIVTNELLPANTNQALAIIRLKKSFDSNFIYQILKSEAMKKYIKDSISVGAQPNLNLEQMNNFLFVQPNVIEQQKIASFLSAIDERIKTQNKIIKSLETLIKGLNDCIFNQKLRFSGFDGIWTSYKVTDFIDFFSTNSLSWEALEYKDDGFYNLHYGIIHQNTTRQLNLDEYVLPSIKTNFLPNSYTLCQDGDIAFADASEDTRDVGKVLEFINCRDKKIVCGLHTIHARDRENLTIVEFKGYIFSSSKFCTQIRQLAQGSKIFSISQKTFNECFIELPCKDEQSKIVQILSAITNKLKIERELVLQYQIQKKYLLQNLFK